jgi:NADPH:quinone reductase-like Zn-dependent oxidoreductase
VRSGAITPVVDRIFPLEEAAGAIRYLEEEHARAKVVVSYG